MQDPKEHHTAEFLEISQHRYRELRGSGVSPRQFLLSAPGLEGSVPTVSPVASAGAAAVLSLVMWVSASAWA